MSDSVQVTSAWSAGLTIAKRTQFQALGGAVFFATGDAAPSKQMAGNLIPARFAVEIEAGETVYWRTDETAQTFATWLETGF